MNNIIDRIIKEYWRSKLPKVKKRNLNPYLDEKLITDIVGPRRAGKTYFMFFIIKDLPIKSTIYLNFENRRLLPLKGDYFNDVIEFIYAEELLNKFNKIHLFLDEIQKINGWESYIRSIYDEFKGKIKIFISGSSSNLLSQDYAKLLTGRHLTTTVLPLSFQEFLAFKGFEINNTHLTEQEEALVKKYLKKYLIYGGFPEVALGKQKDIMLSQLFTDIVSRDILSRADVRNETALEEFSNYIAANVSNLLSFGKMTRYFKSRGIKISTPTLISYFQYMRNAFLFFDNTIFSYKIKDQLQYPRKIYSIDNGIANLAGTENLGSLCENTVAVELLRRQLNTYYWKSRSGEEVDFIVKKGNKINTIQVCYNPEKMDTKERETKALIKCMNEFKLKDGTVITYDYEDEEKIANKKIKYIPLWKFLLNIK
ncbi:MAG: ATP-binding protein [Thermoplasmata archaeon]|nr:ATP-binding protein [Thermoplasmata archaeon]